MTTTLITGANKDWASRPLVDSLQLATPSTSAAGTANVAPRPEQMGGRMVVLDVTDDASVAAAAKTIEAEGGLSVLHERLGDHPIRIIQGRPSQITDPLGQTADVGSRVVSASQRQLTAGFAMSPTPRTRAARRTAT